MKPNSSTIACAMAVCLATAGGTAHAQGALRPVDALIVNKPSQPVPVTVIDPAVQTPTVFCRLSLEFSSVNAPITRLSNAQPVSTVVCPTGVSRLDVQRVLLAPQVPHHRVFLALGTSEGGFVKRETLITTVSDGAPDQSLARPVRIDVTAGTDMLIIANQVCSSGIATIAEGCGGEVYLIGTPAN